MKAKKPFKKWAIHDVLFIYSFGFLQQLVNKCFIKKLPRNGFEPRPRCDGCPMDHNQCLKYLFRRLQKSFSKLKGCVLLKAYSDYAASLQWPATDGCELQFIGKFSQHTSPLRICSTLWLVWADIIPWLQVRIHPLWDEDFGGVGPAESYIFL